MERQKMHQKECKRHLRVAWRFHSTACVQRVSLVLLSILVLSLIVGLTVLCTKRAASTLFSRKALPLRSFSRDVPATASLSRFPLMHRRVVDNSDSIAAIHKQVNNWNLRQSRTLTPLLTVILIVRGGLWPEETISRLHNSSKLLSSIIVVSNSPFRCQLPPSSAVQVSLFNYCREGAPKHERYLVHPRGVNTTYFELMGAGLHLLREQESCEATSLAQHPKYVMFLADHLLPESPRFLDDMVAELRTSATVGAVSCSSKIIQDRYHYFYFDRGVDAVFVQPHNASKGVHMVRRNSGTPEFDPRGSYFTHRDVDGISPYCLMTKQPILSLQFRTLFGNSPAVTQYDEALALHNITIQIAETVEVTWELELLRSITATSLPHSVNISSDYSEAAALIEAALGRTPSLALSTSMTKGLNATQSGAPLLFAPATIAQHLKDLNARLAQSLRAPVTSQVSEEEAGWHFVSHLRSHSLVAVVSRATAIINFKTLPHPLKLRLACDSRMPLFTPALAPSPAFIRAWGPMLERRWRPPFVPHQIRRWAKGDLNYNFTDDAALPLLGILTATIPPGRSNGRPSDSNHTRQNETSHPTEFIHALSYYSKKAYAEKWGYDFLLANGTGRDLSRSPKWGKVTALLQWLPHYQWLMWTDMDTLFFNHNIPAHTMLDRDVDIILASDWNGINNGVFFIRNSPWSRDFLQRMWSVPPSDWRPFQDQGAMGHLLKRHKTPSAKESWKHVRIIPQKWINSYPSEFATTHNKSKFVHGDLLAHFPNCINIPSCESTIRHMFLAHVNESRRDNAQCKIRTEGGNGKVQPRIVCNRGHCHGSVEWSCKGADSDFALTPKPADAVTAQPLQPKAPIPIPPPSNTSATNNATTVEYYGEVSDVYVMFPWKWAVSQIRERAQRSDLLRRIEMHVSDKMYRGKERSRDYYEAESILEIQELFLGMAVRRAIAAGKDALLPDDAEIMVKWITRLTLLKEKAANGVKAMKALRRGIDERGLEEILEEEIVGGPLKELAAQTTA